MMNYVSLMAVPTMDWQEQTCVYLKWQSALNELTLLVPVIKWKMA